MISSDSSCESLKEFLQDEKNVLAVANALFGSSGPKKYDVIEIAEVDDQQMKKRSKCMKGKNIYTWFQDKKNRDLVKLPDINEEDVDKMISTVVEFLMEAKFFHTAAKPDNRKLIFTQKVNEWSKKNVYSWDYDGPAGMRYLKIALTLAAFIAIPTYRIWPRFLQNIVFYTSASILIFLLFLEVIRFLLFCIFYLLGIRLWIFPDLDRDDKGIFGVFYPLISVEKLDDGKNKYRYGFIAVLVAVIAVAVCYPKQIKHAYSSSVETTRYAIQWTRSEWLSAKLAVVDFAKKYVTPMKQPTENPNVKIPSYNPEEEAVYDFDEEDMVTEDDLVDLDDLEDVRLDVE